MGGGGGGGRGGVGLGGGGEGGRRVGAAAAAAVAVMSEPLGVLLLLLPLCKLHFPARPWGHGQALFLAPYPPCPTEQHQYILSLRSDHRSNEPLPDGSTASSPKPCLLPGMAPYSRGQGHGLLLGCLGMGRSLARQQGGDMVSDS